MFLTKILAGFSIVGFLLQLFADEASGTLSPNGANVCSRSERYQQPYRQSFQYSWKVRSKTKCGLLGWGRCTVFRTKYGTRYRTASRQAYRAAYLCCPGWTQHGDGCPNGCDMKTSNGRCCVFPFTYKNKPYSGCTKQSHNKLWCATTSNYDNDQQWGDCGDSGEKEYWGNFASVRRPRDVLKIVGKGCDVKTSNGRCCVFPFTYKNNSYSGCTKQNHNKLWCATTSNYDNDQQWGDCVGCDVKISNGRCCVFPFTYKKKPYSGCTKQNHNGLWCATTSNYDSDKQWGDCVGCDVKTSNGRCCVFPFTYKNNSYSGCTKQSHNRLWCATTSNYDSDKQWGDCVGCDVKTSNGRCCVFPFTYKNNSYSGCTKQSHKRLWCATTSNYDNDQQWGDCVGCDVKTSNGRCCVFPFTYKNNSYSGCTKQSHKRLWCATTSNYDNDQQWGDCVGCDVKTSNGRCCVFPFTYKNNSYSGCTKQNHNRLWCATTSNYDSDKQWGDCVGCDVKISNGRCCVFPFTYKNNSYSGCTKQNHNRLWCATTSNYDNDQQWGDCVGCDVKTTNGRCCVFPFTYKKKPYPGCTKQSHNRLWCATTSNYDSDKQWGDCVGPNPATPAPLQTPAPQQGECGVRPHTHTRIVGGTAATQGSWPWQAQLRTTSGSPYCGGSLIAPRWIMTATHCVSGKSANSIVIRLGAHKRTASVGAEQDIRVSHVITHPSYDKPTSFAHDIALLKLATPARLNNNVNLVCLPDKDPAPVDGKKCWITGWGTLSSGGATPDLLQQVAVPIASRARCDRAYPNEIHDSMICAGLDKGGIDACQGDSGGPMVCENGGRYYIHGATSWGYRCASHGKFGVYAKVKYLLNWVKTEMAKN